MKIFNGVDKQRLQSSLWKYEKRRDWYRGLQKNGEVNNNSVSKSSRLVAEIKKMRADGLKLREVAAKTGLSISSISLITTGKQNKYGVRPTYKERALQCQDKMDAIRYMIKTIDKRNNQIIALGNNVAYFTGRNVKNCGSWGDKLMQQAKGLFCKWGLENKIPGILLSDYMGRKDKGSAAKLRTGFTRSFKKTPENKEMWERFKFYYEEQISENQKQSI